MEVADKHHKAFVEFNSYLARNKIRHSGRKYLIASDIWERVNDAIFRANQSGEYNAFVAKYLDELIKNFKGGQDG